MSIHPDALAVIYGLPDSSVKTIQKACMRHGFRVSMPQIRHARENQPPPAAAIANSENEATINRVLALDFPPGYVAQIGPASKKTQHLQRVATINREAGRAFGGKA